MVLSLRGLKDFKSRIKGRNILSDFVLLNYSYYFSNFAVIFSEINFYYQEAYGLNIDNFKTADLSVLIKKLETSKIDKKYLIGKYR